jgi:hypothetical protein
MPRTGLARRAIHERLRLVGAPNRMQTVRMELQLHVGQDEGPFVPKNVGGDFNGDRWEREGSL